MASPVGVSRVDIFSSLESRIQPSASKVRSAVRSTQRRSALMPAAARLATCAAENVRPTPICNSAPGSSSDRETSIWAVQSPWKVWPVAVKTAGSRPGDDSMTFARCRAKAGETARSPTSNRTRPAVRAHAMLGHCMSKTRCWGQAEGTCRMTQAVTGSGAADRIAEGAP